MFQETTEKESVETGNQRSRPIRKVSVRVFDSAFSVIRGQEKAISGLKERKMALGEIRDNDIPRMMIRWKDAEYTEVQRISDIDMVIGKLI